MKIIVSDKPIKKAIAEQSDVVVIGELTADALHGVLSNNKESADIIIFNRPKENEHLNIALHRLEKANRLSSIYTIRLEGGFDWKCVLREGNIYFLEDDAIDYSLTIKEVLSAKVARCLEIFSYADYLETNPYINTLYVLVTNPIRDEHEDFKGGSYKILSFYEIIDELLHLDKESKVEIFKVEAIVDETDRADTVNATISSDPLA